jgi:hypothetical protein
MKGKRDALDPASVTGPGPARAVVREQARGFLPVVSGRVRPAPSLRADDHQFPLSRITR